MSKVICDICGTVYPESSENCPICGCSRDFGMEDYDELLMDSMDSVLGADSRQMGKKKNREIFDFDEVNQDEEDESEELDEEDYAEAPKSNVGLVVTLLILIVLLLLTAGFIFLRYFLPNMVKETQPTETTVQTMPVETEVVEITVDAGIPCTDIVIPGGKIALGKDGLWLMNVQVYPVDTTDVLMYTSLDESIVTVDEHGTVKAVGEGQTAIVVTCGEMQIKCNVVVDYSLVEETVAAGAIPGMQAEESATEPASDATEATEETKAVEENTAETTAATTTATEAPKETTGSMKLKLKKSDITMFARYSSVTMELDCDIPMKDIEWYTMDSTVAIVIDGVVTATGSGITRIHAKYGSEDVECIVRCQF